MDGEAVFCVEGGCMNYGEQRESQVATLADQRARVRRYLSNTNALESVLADISEGTKVSDIAKRLNVPYQALYTILTGTYKDQYRAARAAHAELLAEKNLEVADKIEKQLLPHDAGKAAVGIRQWHMERSAGEQWGQKSSVDVNHRGVIGLHLDAIRQLTDEPIEGEFEEVEDDGVDGRLDADVDCSTGGGDSASDDDDALMESGDGPNNVVGDDSDAGTVDDILPARLKGHHLL